MTSVTDPLNHVTTSVFDIADRRIASSGRARQVLHNCLRCGEPVSAQQDSLGYFTTLIYDAANRHTATQNSLGGLATMIYDGRSDEVANQDQLGVYTTFQYDGARNRILRTDGRNWPTTFTFDALNREIGRAYIDGSLNTFTFDAAGRQTTMQDITGATGVTSYSYDATTRPTRWSTATTRASVTAMMPRVIAQECSTRTAGMTVYSYDVQNRLSEHPEPVFRDDHDPIRCPGSRANENAWRTA